MKSANSKKTVKALVCYALALLLFLQSFSLAVAETTDDVYNVSISNNFSVNQSGNTLSFQATTKGAYTYLSFSVSKKGTYTFSIEFNNYSSSFAAEDFSSIQNSDGSINEDSYSELDDEAHDLFAFGYRLADSTNDDLDGVYYLTPCGQFYNSTTGKYTKEYQIFLSSGSSVVVATEENTIFSDASIKCTVTCDPALPASPTIISNDGFARSTSQMCEACSNPSATSCSVTYSFSEAGYFRVFGTFYRCVKIESGHYYYNSDPLTSILNGYTGDNASILNADGSFYVSSLGAVKDKINIASFKSSDGHSLLFTPCDELCTSISAGSKSDNPEFYKELYFSAGATLTVSYDKLESDTTSYLDLVILPLSEAPDYSYGYYIEPTVSTEVFGQVSVNGFSLSSESTSTELVFNGEMGKDISATIPFKKSGTYKIVVYEDRSKDYYTSFNQDANFTTTISEENARGFYSKYDCLKLICGGQTRYFVPCRETQNYTVTSTGTNTTFNYCDGSNGYCKFNVVKSLFGASSSDDVITICYDNNMNQSRSLKVIISYLENESICTSKKVTSIDKSYIEKDRCLTSGYLEVVTYCSDCKEELSHYVLYTPKDDHNITVTTYASVKEPTCTQAGISTLEHYCSGCNTVYSETYTVPATGHHASPSAVENRVEPDCTSTGAYELVTYCSDCGVELSRVPHIIPANGHTSLAAIVENRVEPTCTQNGSYDFVIYCSDCGVELSRENKSIPALGHNPGGASEDNRTEPTCTDAGSVDHVVNCSRCGEELSRSTTAIPAKGHGSTTTQGAREATIDSEGYTGDQVCSVCGEVLSQGQTTPKLPAPEKKEEEKPEENKTEDNGETEQENGNENETEPEREIDMETLKSDIENAPVKEETKEVLAALAESNPSVVADIVDSANNTMDFLAGFLESGGITEEEFAELVEKVEVIIETAAEVGAKQEGAAKAASDIQSSMPMGSPIDLGGIVEEFYAKQLALILNKSSDEGTVKTAITKSPDGVLDLTLSTEVYENAIAFIDDSVEKMQDAALMIRECSGEKIVSAVQQYISVISAKTFQDFDKEAADEEFVQAAYNAILLNMQSQVKEALTDAFEEAKVSGKYVGTALTELEQNYANEMASIEDIETFEIMVLEVMRMKYVSTLNDKLENKLISSAEYDELFAPAEDVETFKPIYVSIFRAWALNQESEYGMTLEELTTATIENTVKVTEPVRFSGGLTQVEIMVLASFAALMVLGFVSLILVNNKRRGCAC